MNNLRLTKTNRTKKIGVAVWLIVRKLFHSVIFLLKKINWKKVGFVSLRVVVLALGIVIAFGKLAASMFAGLKSKAEKSDWSNGDVFDDNPNDPTNISPNAIYQRKNR